MLETLTAKDWLNAGSAVLSGVLGGGKQGGPSSALSGSETRTESWLDSSGWTVATGASTARGGDRAQSESAGLANPYALAAGLVALLGVVVVARAWKS